jgi:hypothetical protein
MADLLAVLFQKPYKKIQIVLFLQNVKKNSEKSTAQTNIAPISYKKLYL